MTRYCRHIIILLTAALAGSLQAHAQISIGGDVFGGGENGDVGEQPAEGSATASTAATHVSVYSETVNIVYGGGKNGKVYGDTHVTLGRKEATGYWDGRPAILRSVYGGGYKGAVWGTTHLTMREGRIGFYYDLEAGDFKYNLNVPGNTHNLLKESGNLYGGGYGEGASVDGTLVELYDGIVRNSVYGGGEIAAVGRLKTSYSTKVENVTPDEIEKAGHTLVQMYGGQVENDVFGGGRGYAIDAYGNTQSGEVGYADGYTFGQTEVNIFRGTIGTDASVVEGHGNVFGGGNIGYVYSGTGSKNNADGYYYGADSKLTEDCKVLVSPYCMAKQEVTVNGTAYKQGDYVPAEKLNQLANSDSRWGSLDDLGITIRNAVFAGGNVSSGSDKVYANAKTVFGNATATVSDLFDKDLITLGEDEIGGLYGDGNLTFVDGYRELNITNYGTDFYNLNSQLTHEEYLQLNDRERAYFELQYLVKSAHPYSYYRCTQPYTSQGGVTYKYNQKISGTTYNALSANEQTHWTYDSTTYTEGDKVNQDEYNLMDAEEQKNWDLFGFCTLYAGRMMNTIQRADFCGLFGSRVVLKGAQDRVTNVADQTKYTINRVGEVSLNRNTKDGNVQSNNTSDNARGNYFGIYNVVNYLGGLTSDVDMNDTRTTGNTEGAYQPDKDDPETYMEWKTANMGNRKRNNGSSANQVALASGVWLELVKEPAGTSSAEKDYGYITGVVELDLINVSPDEGGGYVYAKNEHRGQRASGAYQTTLTKANDGAVSNKQFTYATDQNKVGKVETSGNFVHSTKRIVDDCYPNHGNVKEKAHYWYIRGEYYVYDQYISAYTGSAQSYAREVNIPLTITAEAQGKLDMQNAWPNKYAYWTGDIPAEYQSKTDSTAILVNGVTYHKNDPITYWDWQRLATSAEKDFFTDQTFVCANDFKGGGTAAGAGDILLFSGLPKNDSGKLLEWVNKNDSSVLITDEDYQALSDDDKDLYGRTYNRTNAISSANGFALTLAWDNPELWAGTSPRYKCNTSGVYGQLAYNVGDVVNHHVYSLQSALDGNTPTEGQATFEPSYVAKETCKFTDNNGTEYSYVKGACISESTYNSFTAENRNAHFEKAYVCTQTFQIGESAVYLVNDVLTASEYGAIGEAYRSNFSEAYICKTAGKWGGEYYKAGTDYDALKYCNLSADERRNFAFTKGVLDLLYKDFVPQENSAAGADGDAARARYGSTFANMTPINYTATYNGEPVTLTKEVPVKRGEQTLTTNTLNNGDVLTNEVFESLVNEKKHFAAIVTTKDDDPNKVFYVMKTQQQIGDILYAPGNIISEEKYHALSTEQQKNVAVIKRSDLAQYASLPSEGNEASVTYYYCKEAVGSHKAGTIINAETYDALRNEQANFEIQGKMPTATSTFFVVRDVDINDLQQDKVITAEYVYSYIESDESGASYDEIRERHVINIHIHFESGVPSIGQLLEPSAVLPGARVGLNQPLVTKGAYEILGGGWEIYKTPDDAATHKNGLPYINNNTPMYLYQDQYYVAYYAKSYLGKTFSNPVPITVANYHRMEDVMTSTVDDDKTNHYMYLDEAIKIGKQPKVYLDNHACKYASKSELDYLAEFYTASLRLENAKACRKIDFILQSDLESKAGSWTSIGNSDQCFQGNVHGNGNAVKGLTAPLFGSLCGKVYNLGVSGTYNGPLLATSGGTATNCWEINGGTTTTPLLGSGTLTNCYYQSETATATNNAIPKTKAQFLDGEVAYRLNSFYLTARGKAKANRYTEDPYVENYYKDGDFIYAGGTIPMQADIRLQSDGGYKPVYPDDYIFFGQTLSYDKIQNHKQDAHPTAILRDADNYNLLWKGNGIVNSNRVYRAPGYYMSKAQDEVYFNKHAVFVGSYDDTTLPYSRLTAIGFAFNDVKDTKNSSQPVLDYDGLDSYQTDGLTQNLLVYADKKGDAASYALLSNALPEPDFAFGTYNKVARADGSKVKGHLVAKTADDYVTDRHHLLIDRQNFNCPVEYTMGTDKRMWHQRDPERYGNGDAGWETVCLPFTADVVTTHQKGEITHFYTGSTIGHEYWLRQPSGSSSTSGTNQVTIPFAAPAQGTQAKTVDNTFLYDYYYSQNGRDDANADDYQIYYSASRDYADYPRLANGTPYIIAYPDATFYEFDLSGNFEPQNTASPAPAKLDKQTLSFVSAPGEEIKVSDVELSAGTSVGGYTFRGTYLAQEFGNGYEMQADGGSFQKNASGTTITTIPFRAHFTGTSSNAPAITRLLIGSEGEQQEINDWMGRLHIYTEGQRTLVIESGLDYPVTLHLHNVAGQAIKTIPVPAQSRQTVKVPLSGIYIINHQKIVVK